MPKNATKFPKYTLALKVIVAATVMGLAALGVSHIGTKLNHGPTIALGLAVAIVCGVVIVLGIFASIIARIWEVPFS